MFQCVQSIYPLPPVQRKELVEQIYKLRPRAVLAEDRVNIASAECKAIHPLAARQITPAWHVLLSWRANEVEYHLDLFPITGTSQNRLVLEHFTENTADTPQINGSRIFFQAEKKLWGSVPPGDHQLCVVSSCFTSSMAWDRSWLIVLACEAKIRDLENAPVADEQVRSLHIAMKNLLLVQVFDALEQLQHVALDDGFCDLHRRILEQTREIVAHVWHHHIHDAFRLPSSDDMLHDHLFQNQYIRMRQQLQ